MTEFHGLSREAERVITRGYRTVNLKTTAVHLVPALASALSGYDGARVAYCLHQEDGFVPHIHLVAQFNQPQHIATLLRPIALADVCFYLRPCRTFKSSYRYLAHLDSPEKHRVDITSIVRLGDWDGTPLAEWHLVRRLQIPMNELIFLARDYLRSCRSLGISPNPIGFSVFLDDRCVSSRSMLSGLRFMGIAISDLFDYALSLPDSTPQNSDFEGSNNETSI